MIAKVQPSRIPLKKAMFFAAAILMVFGVAFILGGCSSQSDQQRIAELEAQVDRLENEQNAQDQSSDTASADQNSDKGSQSAAQVSSDDATVKDLDARANDLISRAEAAEVPGDKDARIQAFFDLDSEFNSLESEIDSYENQKEAEHRSGSLSWEDYRAIEVPLDQIDNRLDNAKDKLEVRFGIDG